MLFDENIDVSAVSFYVEVRIHSSYGPFFLLIWGYDLVEPLFLDFFTLAVFSTLFKGVA